ncbi:MAG: Ig-like domain-containing protein, partial [Oscillospiraceae bacterium]|nr:Ig-like domain-containing protein [Oscillospiraceae bacterium]
MNERIRRVLSLILCGVLILGAMPISTQAAMTQGHVLEYDFKAPMVAAAKEPWWQDLRAAGDAATKYVGSDDSSDPMSAEAVAAYASLRQMVEETQDWSIDEESSCFANKYFSKQMWLNGDETIPWGLAVYNWYHNDTTVSGSNKQRCFITFNLKVPEEGTYQLAIHAWLEQLVGKNPQTGFYAGGGYGTVLVNGEMVAERLFFGTKGENGSQTMDLGNVDLNEGVNTLTIETTTNESHVAPARRVIYLEGVTLTQIVCDHEDSGRSYKSRGKNVHAVWSSCYDCGRILGEEIWEDCVDADADRVCDLCGGPIVEIPTDPRYISMDFKDLAQQIAKQPWWDDLIPTDHKNSRMIGKLNREDVWTAEQTAAYASLREYLALNTSWNINEELTMLDGSRPKRVFFCADESQLWGLCFYADRTGGTEYSRLYFDVTIPEGGAGWYNLTMKTYKENSGGSSVMYTNKYGCAAGGAVMDIVVNGEKLYNEYSTIGPQILETQSVGAVWMNEGVNTLTLDVIEDYLGGNSSGRRNILLASMDFKPLDGVEVAEYLSKTVTLKETYLAFDADVSDLQVQTTNDLIATASVNADGVVTVQGITKGEAQIEVLRSGEKLCTIPVAVTSFGGSLDDLQGSPAKVDFMAFADRAAEQPWWDSLGEGSVRFADVSHEAVLTWLDENTRWELKAGQIAVNGGKEAYGIGIIDGDAEISVDIPAEGLYGMNVEYLQEEEGAAASIRVNDTVLYDGLSMTGAAKVQKANLGAVLLKKGENEVVFSADGVAKLRSVTFTPLGKRQAEVGRKQYVALNETYLPFDMDASGCSVSSADTAILTALIDSDGDLVLDAKKAGSTTVTLTGEETYTISVEVVEQGKFLSLSYHLDSWKTATMSPGETLEGVLSGLTTAQTRMCEKQLRLDGAVYFASSDPKVAAVDQTTGDVTAVGEGSAKVYAYGLLDGITGNDAVSVVVSDETDLAEVSLSAQQDYVAVSNALLLSVEGKKASGVAADMSLYPVTWTVDAETVASVDENGRVTGLEAGVVTVTASACVNGMPVSDSIQLQVVNSSVLPNMDVVVDFTDGRAATAEHATLEQHGYRIDRERTSKFETIKFGAKSGLSLAAAVGETLAVQIHVSRSGWYRAEITGALYTGGAITDVFVDDTYLGLVDFYAGVSSDHYGGGGERNTVWLDAGVHTVLLECTGKGNIDLGRIIFRAADDPGVPQIDLLTEQTLLVGQQTEVQVQAVYANASIETFLKFTDEIPAYTNYCRLTSSNTAVLKVSGNTLDAVAPGTATVTAACEVGGAEVIRTVEITVCEGIVAKLALTAEHTTVKPETESVQLMLTVFGADGSTVELPAGANISYESEDTAVAEVDENGLVSFRGKEGSVRIRAVAEEDEREICAEIWLTVTAGKTEPTLYTYAERQNAQENVLKYSWAWEEKEKAVKLADYAVEHLDEYYDLLIHDVFPRSVQVGYLNDPKACYCRYCGEDLLPNFGDYPWIIDPINDPWKITCPACKRSFPSNDFGAYYASGLDENGNFSYDLADDSLLVNELYPEMGEGWGVDDGKGFFTRNAEGVEEVHCYIAYYMHNYLVKLGKTTPYEHSSIGLVLPALCNAYLYTGEAKYGMAGAVLTNRLADIYPGYNIKNHSTNYALSDGNGYTGKFVGSIWEANTVTHYLAQAADAFWPAMDDPDVIEYLRARKAKEGIDPETVTPAYIRENVDNGILLEIKRACENDQSYGNFGMHQAGMVMAAVALDRLPETEEMIDWAFRYGTSTSSGGKSTVSGGSVLYNIIDRVDRDGFGNEGSAMYNALWYKNLLKLADAVSGYTRVEGADLWANPRFVNMVGAMMKLTMCGTTAPAIGESGSVQAGGNYMDVASMLTGFINTGNRDLAVAIYTANGYSTNGLHGDIFTKDPEGGVRTKIQKIVDEEGVYDFSRSDMLCGLGLAVLREGPSVLLSGKNEDHFFDFWMQFGITGGTHSNLDSLNIGLDAFGLDLSPDLGYPINIVTTDPQRMQWDTATTSHNTVIVNDRAQTKVMVNSFPLHFDDAGKVKVMDAEAPGAYAEADIYRRTLITVDNGEGVSYAVDLFRVLGGTEHVYSFHAASTIDPKTMGLDPIHQPMGTYAGPNIPFGNWQSNPHSTDAASNIGSGYSWLRDVYRDAAPETTFSIDWQIEDFQHRLNTSSGIHLKLTMLSEEPMAEVALANGHTPQNETNPPHMEYALIRRSAESDMDTLFTSVIEPYRGSSYIEKAELVDVTLTEGEEGITDKAAAIKVTLTSGREDYIVYATNTACTYRVADLFDFRGFVGVCSYQDGKLIYVYGNEATQVADVIDGARAAVTGTVEGFTDTLSDTYTMTIRPDHPVDPEELRDRYIYVQNDRVENGAYRIYGAERDGELLTLDLHTQDLIRNYVDAADLDSGFIYNIAEGQRATIPLSVSSDIETWFSYTTDQVVKAGNKQTLTLGKAGSGAAYEVEGLPTSAKVDAKTGTVTWTPSRTQTGRYAVTVKAVVDGEVMGEMDFVIYVVSYTGSAYEASKCNHSKAVSFEADGMIETVCPACGTVSKTAA